MSLTNLLWHNTYTKKFSKIARWFWQRMREESYSFILKHRIVWQLNNMQNIAPPNRHRLIMKLEKKFNYGFSCMRKYCWMANVREWSTVNPSRAWVWTLWGPLTCRVSSVNIQLVFYIYKFCTCRFNQPRIPNSIYLLRLTESMVGWILRGRIVDKEGQLWDLSIHRFWYLWQVLAPSPTDTKDDGIQ